MLFCAMIKHCYQVFQHFASFLFLVCIKNNKMIMTTLSNVCNKNDGENICSFYNTQYHCDQFVAYMSRKLIKVTLLLKEIQLLEVIPL